MGAFIRSKHDWNPEQYLSGNYFQKVLSEAFYHGFKSTLQGAILDVGCGDGYMSHVVSKNKYCSILGIDNSQSMIDNAQHNWSSSNLSFAVSSIEDYISTQRFDHILSFWCLHWTEIDRALKNMLFHLKIGGSLYALFSSLSDNSIFECCRELSARHQTDFFAECFHIPLANAGDSYFFYVLRLLNRFTFKQVQLTLNDKYVVLPSSEYFRDLIVAMPFINKLDPIRKEWFVNSLVELFVEQCSKKYGGTLYYKTRPIYLKLVK